MRRWVEDSGTCKSCRVGPLILPHRGTGAIPAPPASVSSNVDADHMLERTMTTTTPIPERRIHVGFADLPVPRLERLRDRYAALAATNPAAADYSAAALAEIDAALAAARTKGGW